MNIKSLLIGSAAALAVVSGAKAADAVVAAEPEPMEYVRVCDAYGTGYFYLPGTETCLKIGGKVRFEKYYSKASGRDDVGKRNQGYYEWHTRAWVDVDAKNDSEWGTVYSFIRLQADSYNNTDHVNDFGAFYYMGIGGLEFGQFDTPLVRFHGYTGNTINDGVYANDWDRQYVSYTASFDSFSAMVYIQNDLYNGTNYRTNGFDTDADGVDDYWRGGQNDGGRKFMPDVGAAAKATFGDWEVGLGGGYDESEESFHVRKWVRGDMGMFSVFAMGMYSNDKDNTFWAYNGFGALVTASAKVTDTITISKLVQWWDNDSWQVVGNVAWDVAPGFKASVEAGYADGKYFGNHNVKTGMMRIERTF